MAASTVESPGHDGPSGDNAQAWRDEVAARLSHYRARRKPRPPRYPSLRLDFEPQPTFRELGQSPADQESVASTNFANGSYRALALDTSRAATPEPPQTPLPPALSPSSQATLTWQQPQIFGKLIEFPRAPSSASAFQDELAEPVIERPRILEAPEVTIPPALGGITMEPVEEEEAERRPGIDFPLETAPFARRLAAAVFDWLVILAASVLFGVIFWKVAAVQPPRFQMLALAAGGPCLLWAVYQYLLLVYSGSTPGLHLAGLEITHFDGAGPTRARRRCRVLASYLSAISLGLGYAWLFLDEDALCWHDRITRTHLALKANEARAHESSSLE